MSDALSVNNLIKANIAKGAAEEAREADVQIDSRAKIATDSEENTLLGHLAKTKKLVPKNKPDAKTVKRVEKGIFKRKEMDNLAKEFSQRDDNKDFLLPPSALSRLAMSLGDKINPTSDYAEIIALIRQELTENGKQPDVSQVDKTLEFLQEIIQNKLQHATGSTKEFLTTLMNRINNTKEQHFSRFKVDIEMAQNIIGAAATIVSGAKSTAESLDHLRKMVSDPQDVHSKYRYYIEQGYDFLAMKKEFKLLFTYMGGLVKERLENPHLMQLLEEIKVLQAVLGVYRQSVREYSTFITYLTRVVKILDDE